MIKTLIIEDENRSKEHLVELLKISNLEIKIEAIISSVKDSVIWLKNNLPPDLIFMDIHLSDGKSLDILKKFKIKSPIIYTTAYDEYAIKLFNTNSIDYLLKPIDLEDLKGALLLFYQNRLSNLIPENSPSETFKTSYKKRFLVKNGKEYIPIKTEDIAYFYRSEIVFIRLFNGKSFMTNYSLNQLEEILEPYYFIRINRKIISNINAIQGISKNNSNRYSIKLSPMHTESIYLSQERYYWLKNILS